MIKPIRNQVLVKAFKEDEISTGGIIVPESLRSDGCRVEIIEVGNGTKNRPMRFEKGQVGFRVKNWGVPVEDNGELYYLMEDVALLATM